jgi:hypothetical protein
VSFEKTMEPGGQVVSRALDAGHYATLVPLARGSQDESFLPGAAPASAMTDRTECRPRRASLAATFAGTIRDLPRRRNKAIGRDLVRGRFANAA